MSWLTAYKMLRDHFDDLSALKLWLPVWRLAEVNMWRVALSTNSNLTSQLTTRFIKTWSELSEVFKNKTTSSKGKNAGRSCHTIQQWHNYGDRGSLTIAELKAEEPGTLIEAVSKRIEDYEPHPTEMEVSLSDHSDRPAENTELAEKAEDLHNRSRHNNLCVTGLPGSCKGRPTTASMSKLWNYIVWNVENRLRNLPGRDKTEVHRRWFPLPFQLLMTLPGLFHLFFSCDLNLDIDWCHPLSLWQTARRENLPTYTRISQDKLEGEFCFYFLGAVPSG